MGTSTYRTNRGDPIYLSDRLHEFLKDFEAINFVDGNKQDLDGCFYDIPADCLEELQAYLSAKADGSIYATYCNEILALLGNDAAKAQSWADLIFANPSAAQIEMLCDAFAADADCAAAIAAAIAGNPTAVTSICNALSQDPACASALAGALAGNAASVSALCNALAANASCVSALASAIGANPASIASLCNAISVSPTCLNGIANGIAGSTTALGALCTAIAASSDCIDALSAALAGNADAMEAFCAAFVDDADCMEAIAEALPAIKGGFQYALNGPATPAQIHYSRNGGPAQDIAGNPLSSAVVAATGAGEVVYQFSQTYNNTTTFDHDAFFQVDIGRLLISHDPRVFAQISLFECDAGGAVIGQALQSEFIDTRDFTTYPSDIRKRLEFGLSGFVEPVLVPAGGSVTKNFCVVIVFAGATQSSGLAVVSVDNVGAQKVNVTCSKA